MSYKETIRFDTKIEDKIFYKLDTHKKTNFYPKVCRLIHKKVSFVSRLYFRVELIGV